MFIPILFSAGQRVREISGAGAYVCHLDRYNAISVSYIPGTQIRRIHVVVHYQPKDALLSDKGPETMDLPVLLNRHWPL